MDVKYLLFSLVQISMIVTKRCFFFIKKWLWIYWILTLAMVQVLNVGPLSFSCKNVRELMLSFHDCYPISQAPKRLLQGFFWFNNFKFWFKILLFGLFSFCNCIRRILLCLNKIWLSNFFAKSYFLNVWVLFLRLRLISFTPFLQYIPSFLTQIIFVLDFIFIVWF